jgi:hypothetical protein
MDEKPNFYAVIPAYVRYDEDLSSSQKLFYGEISSLAQKEGYCWAASSYFERLYKVSRNTVYNWIKVLEKKNYISTELVGLNGSKGRKIYITKPVTKTSRAPVTKTSRNHSKPNTTSNSVPPAEADTPYEYTSIENQAAKNLVELETDWANLLNAYSSPGDKGWLSKKARERQKKKFFSLAKGERAMVINWFKTYSNLMTQHNIWLSSFFTDNPTIHDIAGFFRKLKELKDPVKPIKNDPKNNFDPNRNNY